MCDDYPLFWLHYLLLEEKKKGMVYDFRKITEAQLIELSWLQNIVDSVIGELYGVTREDVCRKRARWGLQLRHRPLLYAVYYPPGDWQRITAVFPELKHRELPAHCVR